MKGRYRLFLRRKRVYYAVDRHTKRYESLRTNDKEEALRLVVAMNDAAKESVMNLSLARIYLKHSDPKFTSRKWQNVMDSAATTKTGPTRDRWIRAMNEKPFDCIRTLRLVATSAQDFLDTLHRGTVCTNIYLRRLHNFALDMNWLMAPVIVRRQWPRIKFNPKRAITRAEHEAILAGEDNQEWRAFYRILWSLGGSQSDIANLQAEDVDWESRLITFPRAKTGTMVQIRFACETEQILNDLPSEGPLFPHIATMKESDRAKAFIRRIRLVKVSGVSLHSYRYAWAERARICGYPERFALEALGHRSRAVHWAYARHAPVRIPSLEDYEQQHRATDASPSDADRHPPADG